MAHAWHTLTKVLTFSPIHALTSTNPPPLPAVAPAPTPDNALTLANRQRDMQRRYAAGGRQGTMLRDSSTLG